MIFSITNPTELVDWLQIFCKSGWLSPWDPPLQWRKNPRKKLPPRNTPDSFCRRFTRQNHRCAAWAVFFFSGSAPWKFHEPSERDTGFPANAAAQTGAGTSFGANGDPIIWALPPLLIFCALTIRKHLSKVDFERNGRGQEPSRGHKFSILENFLSIWDFTSQTLASFPSDLVGACLPQTLLMVRIWRCEQQRRVVLT